VTELNWCLYLHDS